jgi:AraC-like DNA-binding protein
MPVERGDGRSLVYGYLDTAAPHHSRAVDTVVVSSSGTSYEAAMRPYHFGELNACEITGDQDVQVRPWRAAASRGLVAAVLLDGGARLEQDGRDTSAGPGEVLLYTGTRPFRLAVAGPYRYFVLGFEGLPATLTQTALRTAGCAQAPAARVFAATLAEFADQAPSLDPATGRELGEHVTGLLRTVLRTTARSTAVPDDLHTRVLDYIETHLGEDIRPDTIAAAHHISVRYLHKLFQQQGETVCGYVRRRRLDRIRATLADPGTAHRPVSSVAAQWGIAEASHFCKLFRAEFGVSPRQFRESALGKDS